MYEPARDLMVKTQIEGRGVSDRRVLSVMRKVERHLFVPPELTPSAYEDYPLSIGEGQTISQPYIVALMTELLALRGREKVLEIGAGSGYQSAILAELAKEVYSIEVVVSLAVRARELLESMGYANIFVKHDDGFLGWPEQAPFDAIMVTCAPSEIPPHLIEQLAEGGRMVVPVGTLTQDLEVIHKNRGAIETKSIIPVRFVPMVKK